MTIQQFEDSKLRRPANDVMGNSLSTLEKTLFKQLHLVQIIGKRDRKIPVLLTKRMKEDVKFLIQMRAVISYVPNKNPFVFANSR